MYHGATAVYLSTTPAHRNLGSLLTGLKPLPKTQGLCITATPNMDSEDVESIAQYSRVKFSRILCMSWLTQGRKKVSFAQTCSCTQSCNLKPAQIGHVSVVIVDGLHQLATRMFNTSTRMETSLHQHNTSEERRPEINSAAGEAQRSSCSH